MMSELATDQPGVLTALTHGALRGGWTGDPAVAAAAAEVLEELCLASDPLPGRSAAVNGVLAEVAEACSELEKVQVMGWAAADENGDVDHPVGIRFRWVTAIAAAVATAEPKAFAAHADGGGNGGIGGGGGQGRVLEWLLRAAECGGPRTAAAALAPWRRAAGGLAGALGPDHGGAACERLVGGVLRRVARTAGAAWRADVAAAVEAVRVDRSGGGCGGGDNGDNGAEVDIDDDDELSLLPELEAAVAAAHAALGSSRFLALINSALSTSAASCGPSPSYSGWENAAAALTALAACGFPLTADAPSPPSLRSVMHLLVLDPPACVVECAPLAALRARAIRSALLTTLVGDAGALAHTMHALLVALAADVHTVRGFSGDGSTDRAAVARAAAAALAATVRAAACDLAAVQVIHPMLAQCEAATAGRLLPGRERAAVMSALSAVAMALQDPAAAANAADALAAGPCGRLNSAAAARDLSGSVGELRVLSAWVSSGAPSRASDAAIEAAWQASGAAAARACQGASAAAAVSSAVSPAERSVGEQCCEVWKGLAAALTWPGKEEHAMKALSAAYALVETMSPVRMTPALTLVASVVEVCGTASTREFQVSVGQLVSGATQVLSASAAGPGHYELGWRFKYSDDSVTGCIRSESPGFLHPRNESPNLDL